MLTSIEVDVWVENLSHEADLRGIQTSETIATGTWQNLDRGLPRKSCT